ncbi:MAG: murein biosynthesis integral membrane protein MurJ, partial [Pseudomonadota bacterium]
LILPFTGDPGQVMAWTVAAAGVGQFIFLLVACRRAGIVLALRRPRVTPGVKRLLQLMGPGMISAGVLQINLVVGTIIASQQAGAVSFLYYADRLYQLPLGLIGIAIGVVLLPELSRKLRAGEDELAQGQLNRGLEISFLLTLPATVALMVIPEPIVIVLYERGALTREASEAIAWAVIAFSAGLPAYVLVKVLQPAFFAREDTVTPLKVASLSVAANVVLSLVLFPFFNHVGIAMATALAAWLNCGALALILGRRGFFALDQRFRARCPRILIAALGMGVVVWLLQNLLATWFDGDFVLRVIALVILVASGLAGYALLAIVVGASRWSEVSLLFRRSKAKEGTASTGPEE